MGEIANDIIDGACCALCGQYFVNALKPDYGYVHAFPVACDECWDEDCGYPPQDEQAALL